MHCLYINLDSAAARRERLTREFQEAAPEGWTLERIVAVPAALAAETPGSISATAKGCFLSHRSALRRATELPGDVLILEDDSAFTRQSLEVLSHLLARGGDWDLLFPEVGLQETQWQIKCVQLFGQLAAEGRFQLQSLKSAQFVGATAYVVRAGSKERASELLAQADLDEPYDFALRRLTHAGLLNSTFVFPFLTTMSEQGDTSQIDIGPLPLGASGHNLLRRLFFLDRDLERCSSVAADLAARVTDPHAAVAGTAITAMLQPQAKGTA